MDKSNVLNAIKLIVLFLICTVLFYICLRILQIEYEQYHRYDLPEGPSVKVHRMNK